MDFFFHRFFERWIFLIKNDGKKSIVFQKRWIFYLSQKSIKKSRKATFAAKIDQKALPGTAFWGKSRFLVIFGLPGGTQKLLKIYESFWVKGSWEPSGGHFERFSAFFSILAPLLVHSGSILGPPGSIFSRFLEFFLFFGSVAFLADLFCFLKVFRHLLDSSHVFS